MNSFWPSSGFAQLTRSAQGWLQVTPDYLRLFLQRPELALQDDSCPAEIALHAALMAAPYQAVAAAQLARLRDADTRDNYLAFLRFRDALVRSGTLEACYLKLMRDAAGNMPPLFIELLVQAIVRGMLEGCADAFRARAAELLFRPQRITLQGDRILAGDRDTLDMLSSSAGMGDIGRLLVDSGAPLRSVELQVLEPGNAAGYWLASERRAHVLDLTPGTSLELSHGLTLKLARSHSGLKALAQVLEVWLQHLLGVRVRIEPRPCIEDPAWRWHVGLDSESSAILNALYLDEPVDPARMERLIGLFQLDFADPREMRADVAGRSVYLGLAMDAQQLLRLKPQNLLLNLPLAQVA